MSDLLQNESIIIKRPGDVIFRKGFSEGSDGELFEDIKANVQPVGGTELLQVPEGDRLKQNLWVFTSFETKVNDIITRKDQKYEVQSVEDWNDLVDLGGLCDLNHFMARAVRLDNQDEQIQTG